MFTHISRAISLLYISLVHPANLSCSIVLSDPCPFSFADYMPMALFSSFTKDPPGSPSGAGATWPELGWNICRFRFLGF